MFSASVFAYGQTSSGKTYTMSGITDCTLVDIYDYIDKVKKENIILITLFSSPFYTCCLVVMYLLSPAQGKRIHSKVLCNGDL